MLYDLCKSMFTSQPGDTRSEDGNIRRGLTPHQRTQKDLLKAAADGCHICNRLSNREEPLWKTLETLHGRQESDEDYLLRYSICDSPNTKDQSVLGWLEFRQGFPHYATRTERDHARNNPSQQECFRQLMVFQLRHREYLPEEKLPIQVIGPNTSAEESWQLFGYWLSRCRSEHAACGSAVNNWHPCRLLDCIDPICQAKAIVKVLKLPFDKSVKYAALSHRWGDTLPIQLLTSNEVELEVGMEIAKLPNTFRDALEVASRLGLYLWIDSLCILQDSGEDWEREAAVMGAVYSNAEVTIAATGATCGLDGMFYGRNPSWIQPCIINRPWNDPLQREVALVDYDLWKDGIDSMGLNQHGWVVQERHLSRRVVHWSKEQLFWECRSTVACESYPNGPICSVGGSLRSETQEQLVYELPIKIQAYHHTPNNDIMDEIVFTYTNSALTFEKDKLFAISRLAQEFSRNFRRFVNGGCSLPDSYNHYAAGLWKFDLLFQLSWIAVRDPYAARDANVQRTETYIAPSWSRASLNGAVSSNDARYMTAHLGQHDLGEVKDISIHYEDPSNLYVQVRSGSITLEPWAINFNLAQRHFKPSMGVLDATEVLSDSTEPGDKIIVHFDVEADSHPRDVVFVTLYQTLRRPSPDSRTYKNTVSYGRSCSYTVPARSNRLHADWRMDGSSFSCSSG